MRIKTEHRENGRNVKNSVSMRVEAQVHMLEAIGNKKRHNMAKQYNTPGRRGIKSGKCASMHERHEQVKLVMEHRQTLTVDKLSSCIRRNENSTSNEICAMF